MTLAVRDSVNRSMTFRDLKSFVAKLSDLSRTLAGDPETSVSDLKFKTSNNELPVSRRGPHGRLPPPLQGRLPLLLQSCVLGKVRDSSPDLRWAPQLQTSETYRGLLHSNH